MEHLNRACKDTVHHLGANKTPQAIQVRQCRTVLETYEFDMALVERTQDEDLQKVNGELAGKEVFSHQPQSSTMFSLSQAMN